MKLSKSLFVTVVSCFAFLQAWAAAKSSHQFVLHGDQATAQYHLLLDHAGAVKSKTDEGNSRVSLMTKDGSTLMCTKYQEDNSVKCFGEFRGIISVPQVVAKPEAQMN